MSMLSPASDLAAGTQTVPNRRRSRRWLVRGLIGLLATIMVLAGAGLIWQSVATARDARAFPPPGLLVDVGGHRIHLNIQGENQGNPTVVLLGCGSCTSANWGWVQPDVAQYTRVVAFDYAGFGWSEPGPVPRDGLSNVRDLHAALQKAGIPPPYVLVGHSYGGPLARIYADRHPGEVVGMVLIDPRHPDQDARFPVDVVAANQSESGLVAALAWMARLGLLRLTDIGHQQSQDLPPQQAAEYAAAWATTRHWQSIRAQGEAIDQTDAQARATGALGDMPLVVISATTAWLAPGAPADEGRRAYTALNVEQVALSSRGVHVEVAGATHASLVDRWEDAQAAIDAIRQVVEAARTELVSAER